MTTPPTPLPGTIPWADLTVPDAAAVRDFYAVVAGWTPQSLAMTGGYDDYIMAAPGVEQPVAGICHARGQNADLPAQWLVYIVVADLDASIAACTSRGGAVISGPVSMGASARYAVIRDPAGAVAALYQAA